MNPVAAGLAAVPGSLDAVARVVEALRRDPEAQRLAVVARAEHRARVGLNITTRQRDDRCRRAVARFGRAVDSGKRGRILAAVLRLDQVGVTLDAVAAAVPVARALAAP